MGFLDEAKNKASKLQQNFDKSKITYSKSAINLCQKGNEQRNIDSHIGELYGRPVIDKNMQMVYPIRGYFQVSIMIDNPNDETGERPYLYVPRIILQEHSYINPLTNEEKGLLQEVIDTAWELAGTYENGELYTYNAYVSKFFIEKLVTRNKNLFECTPNTCPEPQLVFHRGQGFLTAIQETVEHEINKRKDDWLKHIVPNGQCTSIFKITTKLNKKKYDVSCILDIEYDSLLNISTEEYEKVCQETDLRKEFIDTTRFDMEYHRRLLDELRNTISIRNGEATTEIEEEGLSAPGADTGLNEEQTAEIGETETNTEETTENSESQSLLDILVSEGYEKESVEKLLAAGLSEQQIRSVATKA